MSKFLGLSIAALMLGFVLAPSLASAQTPGNGLLSVYVQSTDNYNYNGTTQNPGDFNVQVSGENPSPANFVGSINGTQVSLGAGTYTVTAVNNQYGYTPSYSQGCTGDMLAGQSALCIVTMSSGSYYNQYPTAYPYPYNYPQLSCVASAETVGLQQNVSFTAQGGVGGTYNWTIPGNNYPNVGPVLTASFDSTGTQLVTVTNASQTATCTINVTNSYYPVTPTPTYPTYPTYPTSPITLYPTAYPSLPNTGFAPISATQMAVALAVLAGVALVTAPYVRKAFVIVTR